MATSGPELGLVELPSEKYGDEVAPYWTTVATANFLQIIAILFFYVKLYSYISTVIKTHTHYEIS